jgi:hypothetical protein
LLLWIFGDGQGSLPHFSGFNFRECDYSKN